MRSSRLSRWWVESFFFSFSSSFFRSFLSSSSSCLRGGFFGCFRLVGECSVGGNA